VLALSGSPFSRRVGQLAKVSGIVPDRARTPISRGDLERDPGRCL